MSVDGLAWNRRWTSYVFMFEILCVRYTWNESPDTLSIQLFVQVTAQVEANKKPYQAFPARIPF